MATKITGSTTAHTETAKTLANNLSKSETSMVEMMKKPSSQRNEGDLEELKLNYQKDQRALAMFSELMKNTHELLMGLIRSLRAGG